MILNMGNNCKNIIYGLIDPRNSQLRYIGKSVNGIKRAQSHCSNSHLKRENTRKSNWIKHLLSLNLKPEVEILETTDNNHTLGGEGTLVRKLNQEQKEKLRQVNLNNKHALGKHWTLEQREKLSEANSKPIISS